MPLRTQYISGLESVLALSSVALAFAAPGFAQRLVGRLRYGPKHNPMHEWIYNGADLENEKIVWAQELEPDREAALVRHYKGRHV